MASGRNPAAIPCVLISPVHFEPLSRIVVIRGYEMEVFGVRAFRMPECFHVAGEQEIEWFDLQCVRPAFIQFGQRPDHGGTAHGHTTHSRLIFVLTSPFYPDSDLIHSKSPSHLSRQTQTSDRMSTSERTHG